MSGRARLPAGEPRKASQRNSRRATAAPVRFTPVRQVGDAVRWKTYTGTFKRDVGDGEHSELLIGDRVYRVRSDEIS